MNKSPHISRPKTIFLAVAFLLFTSLTFAFFPTPLMIAPGETGIVFVNGPQGETGAISITSIFVSPPSGGAPVALPGKRTGAGSVPVEFTGTTPGTYTVTFLGKYKGQNVSGSTQIVIRDPATTSAQKPQIAIASDPVNTSTGEYFGFEATDLNLGGPMPLIFARYVGSNLATDGFAQGNLGLNRLHNFASRIEIPEDNGTDFTSQRDVILPSGRRLTFQKSGTQWKLLTPLDVPYTLLESAGSFVLAHPHTQQIWTYNSDQPGKLVKIEDGRGNIHTLTYTGLNLTGVSDGLGRSLTLAYASGRIATVTGQPGNRVVSFVYTSGVLTSATDQGGHTTNYGNSAGLPTSITRPEGNALFTQVYTAGKVTAQTERGTDTSTLNYAVGSTTFTDPTSATLVDNYNSDGRLASHVDEAGNPVTMTYDSTGRCTSVTDRLGDKTSIAFHALSGLPAAITNANGGIIAMTYKARTLSGLTFYDLSKIVYPDGSSSSFLYDAKGNVTQVTNQNGKIWKFTYNLRGQVLTGKNPLGGISTYDYDASGNLISSQSPDVGQTTYNYDVRNRLDQINLPDGKLIVLAYDAKDRLTSMTDERNKTYIYAYDTNNRITSITDPNSKVTTMGYDALDRVTEIIDRNGEDTDFVYNSRRLLTSVTDRNGNSSSLEYDTRRRPVKSVNAALQEFTYGFDDEGLVASIENPENETITIRRNRLGKPVEISNQFGHTTRLIRDAMQRVSQVVDPLGRPTTFGYDKLGQLISAADQGTGTATYTRDALGNITKITDPNGGAWNFVYLQSGRLSSMTDPLGKKRVYNYEAVRGRLETIVFPNTNSTSFSYDDAGNVLTRNHSAGPNLVFTYDDLGRIATVDDSLTSSDEMEFAYDAESRITNAKQNNFGFSATYDSGGRLRTAGYKNNAVVVTYDYDSRNRLISVEDNVTAAVIGFTYDNANRLTGITRSNNVDATFSYDDAGRLTNIDESGGLLSLAYTFNAAGDITTVDYEATLLPSVAQSSEVFKFDKASQITTTGFLYDTRGRMTAAPGRTFVWDGADRLTNANGVLLGYNGLGEVITRIENAQTTRFYHHHAINLAPIVYEEPPTGSHRAYVWTPGGKLLYSIDVTSTEPTFYHFDHLGSTLALTNAAGVETDSYSYGPYGELRQQSGTGNSTQPFTYIGAFGVRTEGALYHMRARYYDPSTAHFLSRDPQPPRLRNPKSLNPYQYAAENPLSYIDPEGTDETREFTSPTEIWQRLDASDFRELSKMIFALDLTGDRAAEDQAMKNKLGEAMMEQQLTLFQDIIAKPPGTVKPPTEFFNPPPGSSFPPPSGKRESLFDLGIYGGGAYHTDWFTDPGFPDGPGMGGDLPGAPPGASGDFFGGDGATGGQGGGGILTPAPLTLQNSVIGGNDFPAGQGGGILPPPGVTDSTFSGNQADRGITTIGGDPNGPIHPETNLPRGLNPILKDFVILPGSN